MKAWTIPVIVMLSLLFLVNSGSAENISDCRALNESGTTYLLTADINGRVGSCFLVTANNITLDCQNYLVDGDSTGTDYGIYNLTGVNYTQIMNCRITDFSNGIRFVTFNFLTVDNVSISTNSTSSSYGVYMQHGRNAKLNNVSIVGNSVAGASTKYGFHATNLNSSSITNSFVENCSSGINFMNPINNIYVGGNVFANVSMTNTGWGINLPTLISNVTIYNNSFINLATFNPANIRLSAINHTYCDELHIMNNTGNNGLPILFYNTPNISIMDRTDDFCDIILCNADNSIIDNVMCDGTCENVFITFSENLTIRNSIFIGYNSFRIQKHSGLATLDNVSLSNATYVFFSALTGNVKIMNSRFESYNNNVLGIVTPVGDGSVLFGGLAYSNSVPMELNISNSVFDIYAKGSAYQINEMWWTGALNTLLLTTPNNFSLNIDNSIIRGNDTVFVSSNTSGNFNIRDSTLSKLVSSDFGDIYSFGSQSANNNYNFYNVTFTDYNISAGTLGVYWKLLINNSFGADLKGYDINSLELFSNNDASVSYWAKEYNVTAVNVKTDESTKTITLNMSKTGYISNSTDFDMTVNMEYTVSLSAEPIIKGNVTFNILDNSTGHHINGVNATCNNSYSEIGNSPITHEFDYGDYICTFTNSSYYSNESIFTVDSADKEVNVTLSLITIPIPTPSPIDSLPDIFVQLVLTLGFGIIAIFACLTLIVSKEDANVLYQPENFIKLIIAVVIVILMLVGVWMGLVL